MLNNFTAGKLDAKMHRQIIKTLLFLSNAAGVLIYLFLHLILFDFPFEPVNEAIIVLKLFAVASSFAVGISLLLVAADTAEFLLQNRKQLLMPAYIKTISVAALVLIIVLSSCTTRPNTGLASTFNDMKPQNAMMKVFCWRMIK